MTSDPLNKLIIIRNSQVINH